MPLTLRDDPRRQDRGANFLRLVARLGPGVSLSQAKADLDADKAIELMLAQPSMIKRPVLDVNGRTTVGFKPEIYETFFAD